MKLIKTKWIELTAFFKMSKTEFLTTLIVQSKPLNLSTKISKNHLYKIETQVWHVIVYVNEISLLRLMTERIFYWSWGNRCRDFDRMQDCRRGILCPFLHVSIRQKVVFEKRQISPYAKIEKTWRNIAMM